MKYKRNIAQNVLDSVQDTPVVLINGARQTGKSTFIQDFIKKEHPAEYRTMDDPTDLGSAKADALTFLRNLPDQVALDEIQRVPEIFIAIKKLVDENRKPGKFMLTGSANVLLLPKLSESLTGRMEIHTMWPLSQGEIRSVKEGFIDCLFSNELPKKASTISQNDLFNILLKGGFPEALDRSLDRAERWFNTYLATTLQRDVKEIANIEKLAELPNLLSILANRVGSLLNFGDLSRTSKLKRTTLQRYFALLSTVFLIRLLPAWHTNLEKRVVKSPKIYLIDTGFLCHLKTIDKDILKKDRTFLGAILENFVVMEVIKQSAWNNTRTNIYHYHTQAGAEVDIVLEGPGKKIVGIEVKSASTVTNSDFSGLRSLKKTAKGKFHRGVILYTGDKITAFGEDLYAVPISALWEFGATPTNALKGKKKKSD